MSRNARPYQLDTFEAVRSAFKRGLKGVVVCKPTGTGKTVDFCLIAKMVKEKKERDKNTGRSGRVLILVNRTILVRQTLAELSENGLFAQREQAEERASLTAETVCGSIQSFDGKWLDKWPKDHFDLVILDECHASGAKTIKRVLDHFSGVHHVGFSATPERHDRKGLWSGYQEICYNMTLKEAIDLGWLCGFEFVDLDCPVTVDLKLAKKANLSETDEVFDSHKYLPRLADCTIDESLGRKGLFFLPNCRVSKLFAEALRERGLNAHHVDSSYMRVEKRKDWNRDTMTPERTEEFLDWFAGQESAFLCNADLLSVGYNQPDVDTIGLFRPIASTPMYKQRLGRGTRPVAPVDLFTTEIERIAAILESKKPFCKVLNVFWENGGHDLASPSCLVTDDEEEQKELDKQRKPGKKIDMAQMELQLKAAKTMKDEAEEMRKYLEKVANSQAKKSRKALYIGDILRQYNPNHKPASDKFVQYVRRMGVDIPPGQYSAYQIMRIKERAEKHKAV